MLILLNYFKTYFNYLIYLFIYLLFIGFLGLISFNEELVICIALIIYFISIFSILRKIILVFFYYDSESLYILFYVIIGLNILYIKAIIKYFSVIFNSKYRLKNIKIYLILTSFIKKFKSLFLFYLFKIKNLKDKCYSKYNKDYSDLLFYTIFIYSEYISNYFNNYNTNIRYFLSLYQCQFSIMYLNFLSQKNISCIYVS